jgi:uncharacterized repeat protein (TIGR01451 family)
MSARNRSRPGGREIARASRRAGLLAIVSAIVLLVGQVIALANPPDDHPGNGAEMSQGRGGGNENGRSDDDESEAADTDGEDSTSDSEADSDDGSDVESDADAEAEVESEADVRAHAHDSDDDDEASANQSIGVQGGGGGTAKITICHRTNSTHNPYVQITISVSAADGLSGPGEGGDHFGEHTGPIATSLEVAEDLKADGIKWGDIIPPIPGVHDGMNWPEGEDILEAGCEFVSQPPPALGNLGIVKTGPASATVGSTFSFTVTVTNTGSGPANNVTVTDNVSGALTVTAVTFTTPTVSNGVCAAQQNVNCNVGTLQAGQVATVTITVTVTPNACPQIQNTASVRADDITGAAVRTSDTITVQVPCPPNQPSLALNKTGTATVTQGGAVTYTVTVTNSGTGAASSVVITDNLDDAFTSVAASSTIGTCSVAAGNVVTCNVGTLNAGESATITITANAPTGTCPTITNQATGTHAGGTIPVSGTVTTTVTGCAGPAPEISVRIQKTNDANEDGIFSNNEESKNEGRDVDFRLVITNTSDETVRITDLTDAFDQTVLDLLDGECDLDGVELDPGESVTCTFTLESYSPPEDTAIVNVAEVCVQIVGGVEVACDDNPSRVRSAVVLGRTVTPSTPPPAPPPTRTPPGGIAFTGPATVVVPLAALALVLLTVGTGFLWAGRRRGRVNG